MHTHKTVRSQESWREWIGQDDDFSEYDRQWLLSCNATKFPPVVLAVLEEHRQVEAHEKANPDGPAMFKRHVALMSNGVLSADFDCPVPIERVLMAFIGASRTPIRFPRVQLHISPTNDRRYSSFPALFVYSTGKVMVSGAPLVEEALYVVQRYALELSRIGCKPRLHMAVVVNMVARSNTDAVLSLERLAAENPLIMYKPKLFAGAQYKWRPVHMDGTPTLITVPVLMFGLQATRVLAGGPTHDHIYMADKAAHDVCLKYYMKTVTTAMGSRVYDTSGKGPTPQLPPSAIPTRGTLRNHAAKKLTDAKPLGYKRRNLRFTMGNLSMDSTAADRKTMLSTPPPSPPRPSVAKSRKRANSATRKKNNRPKVSKAIRIAGEDD